MKKTIIFSFVILFLLSCRTELQTSQEYKKQKIIEVSWYVSHSVLSHPVSYECYKHEFFSNIKTHWIHPDSVSSIEITATVDSILRSGTVTKLKGEWYKKAFSCYWIVHYFHRARIPAWKFFGEYPDSLKNIIGHLRVFRLAENWQFANDTQKVDFLVHMIQPKYNIRYSTKKERNISKNSKDKILLIGYKHFNNDPRYYYSLSDIDADFEYYYDGKDFYLLSNIAFHALDKYLKHKMGIKSILEEKLEKEKEEKKKDSK